MASGKAPDRLAPLYDPAPPERGTSRNRKGRSALFALGLLVATIGVLAVLFVVLGQRAAPTAYPGLRGFPKVGSMPSKAAGDLVTFVFAFLVGLLIQRSRWCNASAIRDAILFRSFRNTKPLVLAMMIITAMFTIFEAAHLGQPINIVGGAFTVLGLFLFGIGMVLGGACTVSVWIRSAEGSMVALWALIYTFVGMFLFSELWNVMRWPAASYLQSGTPKLSILSFGSFNAFSIRSMFGPTWGPVAVLVAGALQVALLAFVYRRMLHIERREASGSSAAGGAERESSEVLTLEAILGAADTASVVRREPDEAKAGDTMIGDLEPVGAPGAGTSGLGGAPADSHSVNLDGWGAVEVDRVIDCSGEMCPRPQLLTKRAVVREMAVGQVLELVVDNPSSPELVPTIMSDIGAVHLGTERDALAWHLYIRKEREPLAKAKRGKGGPKQ